VSKVIEFKTRRAVPKDKCTVLHLRLPAVLVQRLKKIAAANFRTMTQEAHLRLVRDLDKNK
jgi:hypothetical protein